MRNQTIMAFLFIAVLSVFVADVTVGCGQGYVHGAVTQKYTSSQGTYLIAVNGTPYEVPVDFYNQVRLGDMVRYNGKEWSIDKPGENVPNIPPSTTSP
jgi:hypothetical protein